MAAQASERLFTPGMDSGEESQLEMKHALSRSHSREFKSINQTWRLFGQQIWRLLITCVFVGCVMITIKVFENSDNFSHNYKVIYNTILTALSLGLGLNFFDAFKDMARILRWRLLADRPTSIREMDLILGGDSVTKPLRLLWESPKKPIIFFSCFFWICLNVGAQIAVAIISLTYSVDNGQNSSGTYTVQSSVDARKLDCFYNGAVCPGAPESNMTIAHNYGMLTRGTHQCPYSNDTELNAPDQSCNYFGRRDGSEFAYRFWEVNPNDRSRSYPFLTNRNIRASQSQCFEYEMDPPSIIDTTDGIESGMLFQFHNATYNGTMAIPRYDAAFDATTYIYNGTLAPQNATTISCGRRCIQMWAYRSHGDQTPRPDRIFSCQITVSEVHNATQPAHHIPDDVARMAAASIGLSGRYTHPNGPESPPDWHQYTLFPWGADWEINNLTANVVGSRMAEFAIGTIAGMSLYNPPTRIMGTLPILGYHLSVHWPYLIALLACIAGAHAILFGLMLWISRPVVVVDDSFLCTTRLLQDLVGKLEGGGSLLTGKQMANAIQQGYSEKGGNIMYGVKNVAGSDKKTLGVGEDVLIRKRLTGREFPKGVYI